jgi:hypothetical protein
VLAPFRSLSTGTLSSQDLPGVSRNFKAVVMIVAGESPKKWLEELNRSTRLEIPLTFFTKGPKDVATRVYKLNPAVANTFLVTADRISSTVLPTPRRKCSLLSVNVVSRIRLDTSFDDVAYALVRFNVT